MTAEVLEVFSAVYEPWVESYYRGDSSLARACRYALGGTGKRIRPCLVLLTCEACGGEFESALAAAVAVELLHTYSLVHDDLPLCDDDDWRRGRPSVHKEFDEVTALLVGDALLSDAWLVLADDLVGQGLVSFEERLAMIRTLSCAVGSRGMVLGQSLDMSGEAGTWEDLRFMHSRKTGDLIQASCVVGGIAAGASESDLAFLSRFGEKLGLMFQLTDDLIDDLPNTGKSQGKDLEQGKVTGLSFRTREELQVELRDLGDGLKRELQGADLRSGGLMEMVGFFGRRSR